MTAKPDEVGFGASLIAVHGRLVFAENMANNPGIQIPMQSWYPNRTSVQVPMTWRDMALAEIARKAGDVTCWLDLAAIANIRHQPPNQPQTSPAWPTQAWMTTVVRDNGSGTTFTLLRQHWLKLLKDGGFERVRLVELPVASGAVGPKWNECMRLLQRATGELRSGQSEIAVGTCREVVEGVVHVLEQQLGITVAKGKSIPVRLKELAGRLGAAWPDDKYAGEMLAGLYGAAWSWTSGEHHYGSRVPRHDEAEFAVGLTAALLTHAGHLLNAHPEPIMAKTGRPRTTSTPGVSSGTSTMLCWRCVSASGSVLPMTMATLQRSRPAPVLHHLRPSMTYSSPSRRMRVWMLRASELATSGSVMQKHDLICPSRSGRSHVPCCSAVPNWARISMLPVSGAEQFIASGAIGLRPEISARGAYWRLVRPAPQRASGRNRFQRLRARASRCSSSITGGWR